MPHLFESDTVVLTPNRRLARHLQRQQGERRLGRGERVWESPTILPWQSWLRELWELRLPLDMPRPALLTPHQSRALWQQVIEASPEGEQLLNPAQTARTAEEAWQLLCDHGLRLDPRDGTLGEDAQAFAAWSRRFVERCDQARWLDAPRLAEALEARLPELEIPPRLRLEGFDEIPPQARRLLDGLQARGCEIEEGGEEPAPGRFHRVPFPDPEAECRAAAAWALDHLTRDPRARLGLVVPNLEQARSRLERILEDTLQPLRILPERRDQPSLVSFSLGQPLTRHPAIQDAMLILELARGSLGLEEASRLLRSPFLRGADREGGARALLDRRLRSRGGARLTLADLHRLCLPPGPGPTRPYSCPLLGELLEELSGEARALPDLQAAGRWGGSLWRLLRSLGWPGDRPDPTTLELGSRWRETLDQLSELERISPPLDLEGALARLRDLGRRALFQPRAQAAPVQVLGVLEAAGLRFDHLWIMGLHDEAWPPSSRPNPLLPPALQRQHGMPHSSPERELEFARRLTDRLLRSAPSGVSSHPTRIEDRELRPSPLIRDLPGLEPTDLPAPPLAWCARLFEARRVEWSPDRSPHHLEPGALVRGGTGVFKLQAACPFRAFAEHRLGAEPIQPIRHGLSPAERGTLLHATLEHLWGALGSLARLTALPPPALQERIQACAVRALGDLEAGRLEPLGPRFRQLEGERLARLALAWLEIERERDPFHVVETEQSLELALGGLRFRAKVDRLDRLETGGLAVIDYKTFEVGLGGWKNERPDEPQLMLYAAAAPTAPEAVVFAQVRTGKMAFTGVSRRGGLHPGAPPLAESRLSAEASSWEELLERWRERLGRLASEFLTGYAEVSPRSPSDCLYCTQRALCRIDEPGPADELKEPG